MTCFAVEADVRLKFQLSDTTLVSSALITASIEDAHTELLRRLDPAYGAGAPDDALVMGEILLAGAHLFRSLASKDAFEQKQIALGGQRMDAGKRFSALMTMAELSERDAWYLLEPYITDAPARTPMNASDTVAVLGEE